MKHWKYLKYLVRHKWFVFVASCRIGSSLWLAIIHDWSKFRPSEWTPYVDYFYKDNSSEGSEAIGKYGLAEGAPYGFYAEDRFNIAWLHHQNRNKHHYQYWKLIEDSGNEFCLPMPEKYAKEMISDWMGACRAITGKWDVKSWYKQNKYRIQLRMETRQFIEKLLNGV